MSSLSRLVGNRSDLHCLMGSARAAAMTSLTAIDGKQANEQPSGALESDVAGTLTVAVRTPATFSLKK